MSLWRNDNGRMLRDLRADGRFSGHVIGSVSTSWYIDHTNHVGLTIV